MFDFVRTHTRLLQFLLVLLVFPSFVFFGVQGYSRFTEGGNATVAEVDGHAITQAQWDAAHQQQAERLRQQMPGVDAKLLDSPQFKRETLDQLVRERVLMSAAEKQHLAVNDERLQRLFVTDPQYAFLRNPDNSINTQMLAAQGMSSAQFAERLRRDLTLRQVLAGITETAPAMPAAGKLALDALLQQRQVQLQRFNAADYAARVTPTDAELKAHYDANQARFKAPEQAVIEYVVLNAEALQQDVNVSEEDLRKYYDENAARYTSAEQRRASHILIASDKDQPAAERAKAKAKAEALLAELRKNPASFADVAKKESQDPGSAQKGGDLDFFARGAMVKPFEDAAFAMKPGEISNVVETDFGYHIIRLDAVRGGEKKPFEAVRGEIEAEVRKQLAQSRYTEAAEQFTNTVYEQPDSLQPVIDKLKLKKQTATVQRTPAPGAAGALASAKLLEAVFSNDVLRNKRNTEAVEIGANQLVSARVVEYRPERVRPFEEVQLQVRERVVAEQSLALARKDGQARLAQLKEGGDAAAASLPAPVTVSRAERGDLAPAALDAVMRADASKLPALLGVDVPQGFVVARLIKVEAPNAQSPALAALQGQYPQAWASAEGRAYYETLKKRFDVKIKAPAVAAVPAESAASEISR
ncbi:SurA N-terminal domain-containing protein [Azohydromonas caseinilytica]|uniref:Periplasmic chaperone PpiD n=1 Tax=Azohydromonas caseinilytica TaxID=2728836 RepID=A0A848F7W7_9BURK|nr:SurA N-terminal domain-containing protein [Azohydromonas caseinilytica]NML15452.1 peptidyl-prolyl cis-trans isomerase [Azohydromonas caseinilytica]